MSADGLPLLTSVQMAEFVANGFLRFDALVPAELNALALEEMASGRFPGGGGYAGQPYREDQWAEFPGMGGVMALPAVRGIIASLVGPEPVYDAHAVHIVEPRVATAQSWHADAIIDLRPHFDLQLFYFPHDTPRDMGGTMFLPGSQFRRICMSDVARYQNFVGQYPVVCQAGTVFAVHQNVWHCSQPNATDATRYMFKLRLNATRPQVRRWDTSDLDDPRVVGLLNTYHEWHGNEHRIELVQRIKLWRHLIGDESFDSGYWLGRLENTPA